MTASASRPSRQWLIYALGGGQGHLCRSLALARQAARSGVQATIVSNSPLAASLQNNWPPCLLTLDPRIQLLAWPSAADKSEIVQRSTALAREHHDVDALVVDTFPRGLAGELAALLDQFTGIKIFVHRDLNPDYIAWADLKSFAARYDLLILPGEDAPLADLRQAVRTPPWLICDADEWLAPAEARRALQVPNDHDLPVCVVLGAGQPAESLAAAQAARSLAAQTADRMHMRFLSLDDAALAAAQSGGVKAIRLWPAMLTWRGVDLIVGAGGYNSIHEARATQTPIIAVPQPRLYDRQSQRLTDEERALDWTDAIHRVLQRLHQSTVRRSEVAPSCINGAAQAVQSIAHLFA